MAQAGKAQVLMREGNVAAARAALATAKDVAVGLAREASHIAFFDLVFGGRTDAAIAALHEHLVAWPRDALVLATAANPNGLIGASGSIGQKHQIAVLLDSLASHYGDDFWFLAHHAMALSEDGQLAAARPKIERSVAANPNNAHGAHAFAHVCYESGERDTARTFLSSWLTTYPRDGFFHGHLNWHLSLCELLAGNWTEALRLYQDAMTLDRHSGGPQQKMSDATAFLWRSELAGHPRDAAAWRAMYQYANSALPRPGSGGSPTCTSFWHRRSWAMTQPSTSVPARWRIWRARGVTRRTSYLPALSRGFMAFERGDFSTAIEVLAPLVGESERIGGRVAQHDLIEFTLLKAYLRGRSAGGGTAPAWRAATWRIRRSRRRCCGGALTCGAGGAWLCPNCRHRRCELILPCAE